MSLYGFTRFDEMTGCSDRVTEPAGACGSEFEETRLIVEPPRNEEGTPGCMSAFSDAYQGGFSANAANVRAMLYVCFGANGLFTGVG